MDNDQIISYLNQKMNEFRSFEKLAVNNIEFPKWCTTTELYLFNVFGEDSIEYKTFKESGISHGLVEEQWREYHKALHRREVALTSIISSLEIRQKEELKAIKNTSKSPVDLFYEMQFHPKVIEASQSCFITNNYRESILNAFISFIDYIKEITSLDLDGDDLMNQVFSFNYDKDLRKITKYPTIRINDLKNSTDRSEQQGFMFLCKGAAAFGRNPKAHKLIPQTNPLHTLEYLAFASLLMRRADEGSVVKPGRSRKRWNLNSILDDAKKRCKPDIVKNISRIYDFTDNNADKIYWGTGALYGSFTFHKFQGETTISIYTVSSSGWICLNFGYMKDKGIDDDLLESFRNALNEIPGIRINKDVITSRRWPEFNIEVLIELKNLKQFQDAVTTLCKQIDLEGVAN